MTISVCSTCGKGRVKVYRFKNPDEVANPLLRLNVEDMVICDSCMETLADSAKSYFEPVD